MEHDRESWRTTLIRRAVPPGVLVVTGCAMLIAWGDEGRWAIAAFALIGVAAVLAVSLAFYEVGLSEDRQRAHEAAQRGRGEVDPATADPPSPAEPAARPDPHRTAPIDLARAPRRAARSPRRRGRGDDR